MTVILKQNSIQMLKYDIKQCSQRCGMIVSMHDWICMDCFHKKSCIDVCVVDKTQDKRESNNFNIFGIDKNDFISIYYIFKNRNTINIYIILNITNANDMVQIEWICLKNKDFFNTQKFKIIQDFFISRPTYIQENHTDCPICFESKHDTSCIILPCNHKFCTECIAKILAISKQHNCPMCRKIF